MRTRPECVTIYTEQDMMSREMVVATTVRVPDITHHFRVPVNAPYILDSCMEKSLEQLLTAVTKQIVADFQEKRDELYRKEKW